MMHFARTFLNMRAQGERAIAIIEFVNYEKIFASKLSFQGIYIPFVLLQNINHFSNLARNYHSSKQTLRKFEKFCLRDLVLQILHLRGNSDCSST